MVVEEVVNERKDFVEPPVVAAFIRRPRKGELLLISRKGKFTLPTGKFDRDKELELRQTLFRELGEEIFGLKESELGLVKLMEEVKKYIAIIGILDVLYFNAEDQGGGKAAVMVVFLCRITEEGAEKALYRDGEESDFCWVVPAPELAEGRANGELDRLARREIKIYLELFAGKRKIVKIVKWLREGMGIIFTKADRFDGPD